MNVDLPTRRSTKPTSSRSLSNTKKSPSIPQETVEYLKAWMMSPEHIAHPYPTEQEKAEIMADTGIELKQLTNWFVNNRKRFWKPRVEAKLTIEEGNSGRVIPGSGSYPSNNLVRPRLIEDTHTVSEQGSVASSSSQWNSDDDEEDTIKNTSSVYHRGMTMHAGTIRREVVDVHVLIPQVEQEEGSDEKNRGEVFPTLRDMTIKTNVKKEQILATFPKCLLQYTMPEEYENDRKKIQIRRDGEVLRVKKHYLKLYLATRGIHSVSSPYGENPIDIIAHSSNNSVSTALSSEASVKSANKRSVSCDSTEEPTPRRRRVSSMNGDEEWRSICQNASDIFCDTLPGLEEAAIMFGYIAP